nr:alpha/beta hydrolase [uncultured Sphingomonas sp.]
MPAEIVKNAESLSAKSRIGCDSGGAIAESQVVRRDAGPRCATRAGRKGQQVGKAKMIRPTLVLLCGLLCDERMWAPVRLALSPELDARIIAFAGFRTIEAMAAAVLAQVPGPLVVIGHSMGGRVALELVRQSGPRVVGLGLANTGIHPPAPDEAARRQELVDRARSDGMEALADAWLPPMMGASGDRVAQLLPDLRAMVAANARESYEGQIAALLARPDAETPLRGYKAPLLLLAAEQDRWSPPAQHEAMRDLAPQGELHVLADAGHMLPVERPEAVAQVIGDWFRRHWPEI